jgi:hypothetical protein
VKSTRPAAWRYLGRISLLLSALGISLPAENFSEWSAPVNLGNTANTAAAEQ